MIAINVKILLQSCSFAIWKKILLCLLQGVEQKVQLIQVTIFNTHDNSRVLGMENRIILTYAMKIICSFAKLSQQVLQSLPSPQIFIKYKEVKVKTHSIKKTTWILSLSPRECLGFIILQFISFKNKWREKEPSFEFVKKPASLFSTLSTY